MTVKVKNKPGRRAIRSFLTGPRLWEEGLHLYLKHGSNQALKSIFQASGETAYNYQKLIGELEGMCQSRAVPAASTVDRDEPSRGMDVRIPVAGTSAAPAAVDKAYNDAVKKLFQERSMLHAQLLHLSTDEERKAYAFQILDISEQVDYQLNKEAATMATTTVEMATALPEDRAQLVKILNNNRAYISKNKQRPEKAQEVEKRIQQNLEIEKRITSSGNQA